MTAELDRDRELVSKALSGDDEAMAALIAVAMPIARAKAHALEAKNSRLSGEDLVQEGMLGFLRALETYSPEKNAAFRTYVDVCIGNRMRTAVKASFNFKNLSLTSALPIPEDDREPVSLALDPQEILASRDKVAKLNAFLNDESRLSGLEIGVVKLRMSGKSYSETAKLLGISTKAVDNALQRVKKKLREHFTD